ncbi:MAG: hypothetical protein ACR2NM_06410, partial [Bythopirellula sp.]
MNGTRGVSFQLARSTEAHRRIASWKLTPLVLALLSIVPQAMAQKANTLPQKQHKISDAPFLSPSEAVAKMS